MKGEIMKQLTGIIIIVLAVFTFQLTASAADTLKIGVLDFQKCIKESNEGKRLAETLKKKQTEMVEEIKQKEQEYLSMQSEIEKQSLMMSADAKERKLKELDKMERDYKYKIQYSREDMQKLENDAMVSFRGMLLGVVEKIAKEKKYDLITERSATIYISKDLDITDEVIVELNKVKP